MRRIATLCAISLMWMAAAGHADDEDRAKELFEEATSLHAEGKLGPALDAFRAAYDHAPRAKILLNIGAVLLDLERDPEAADVFADYLERDDRDPERVDIVRQTLAELDATLGRIELDVRAADYDVVVDTTDIGRSPLEATRRARPGRHTVLIRRDDGWSKVYDVDITAGTTHPVDVTDEDLAVREPQTTPPTPDVPNRAAPPRDAPPGKSLASRPWLWTGLLTVGLLAGGVTLGLQASSLEDDLAALNADSANHTFAEAQDLEDRAKSRALWANIGFGAAGVAAIATIVLIIRDSGKTGSGESVSVSAAPTRGGAAFAVEVPF